MPSSCKLTSKFEMLNRSCQHTKELQVTREDGFAPLHFAVQEGNREVVNLLIWKGADVDAKDDDGGTPLYFAAMTGHKEVVKLLIAAGADVNAKDVGSNTPLDMAIMENQTETADLLRKHGGKTKKELEVADN